MVPVPIGEVGEIYMGGMCVSPGYINLPEQTAERFLDDPFVSGGGRMFRTGDYGRLLPNGNFEIHGRKDSQVKLKGYRIELDEIGEAMMRHPQVTAAAAIVKDKTHLVGYFTPMTVDLECLSNVVASFVPAYMVPSVWIALESMPQNANGKIDRRALEKLDISDEVEAPVSNAELLLARIWAEVLCIEIAQIGRQASFFALGGDSLSVIKVVQKYRELGLEVSSLQLMREPILWRAAQVIDEKKSVEWPAIRLPSSVLNEVDALLSASPMKNGYTAYPVSSLQAGMLFESAHTPSAYVLQETLALDESIDVDRLCQSVQVLTRHHDVILSTFVSTKFGIFQVFPTSTYDLTIGRENTLTINEFLTEDASRGFEFGQNFTRFTL
ncbi:unnamed protein product, partial [Aphanomyces euteiches]